MSAIDILLSRLDGVRQSAGNAWMAKCPAHPDRSPSLAVSHADDGRILVHCFAGCEPNSVLDAVGMSIRDLFPQALTHHAPPRKLGVNAFDVLRAMRHETLVLQLIAEEFSTGEPPPVGMRERAHQAAERIRTALALCDG